MVTAAEQRIYDKYGSETTQRAIYLINRRASGKNVILIYEDPEVQAAYQEFTSIPSYKRAVQRGAGIAAESNRLGFQNVEEYKMFQDFANEDFAPAKVTKTITEKEKAANMSLVEEERYGKASEPKQNMSYASNFGYGSETSPFSSSQLTSAPQTVQSKQSQSVQSGLQPSDKTISAYDYSGEPPQRYKQPFFSALGQSFKNIFNFGIIGQQGFKAYTQQAFFTPFEYVGEPKAYKTIGTNINPTYRGTEFGFGAPSPEQKEVYVPEGYKDTSDITYFNVGEQKKRDLFLSAGLDYKGEPARLLPQRLSEDVAKDLRPKYQAEVETGTQKLFDIYQGKVESGELTQPEAQKRFEAASSFYTDLVNTKYQAEASSLYGSRMKSTKEIAAVEAFDKKIFEPPAYPIIRGTGKAIEIGAIAGATAFGGSTATLATSAYLTTKTADQAVQYKSDFGRLTTGQKIAGGASVGLGILASGYTFRLGVTRFYSEWRGAIYSDLARTPAKVSGREILRTEELNRYAVGSVRRSGVNTAQTVQRVDVYKTGDNRVGFFTKGITKTRIFDPQTQKYLYTTEKFSTSGFIPDIQQGSLTAGKKGASVVYDDVYSGQGYAVYSSPTSLRKYSFLAGSKELPESYSVFGGSSPRRLYSGTFTTQRGQPIYFSSTTARGNIDSYGSIAKLQEPDSISYIISSGSKKSSGSFINSLYSTGAAGTLSVGSQAQKFSLGQIASQKGIAITGKSSPAITTQTTAAASREFYGSAAVQNYQQDYVVQTQPIDTRSRQISAQLPTLNQLGLGTERSISASVPTSSTVFSFVERSRVAVIPATTPTAALAQVSVTRLRSGLLSPTTSSFSGYGTPAPIPTNRIIIVPQGFDFNPAETQLSSRLLSGGRRITGYTPSFSALYFNIRGRPTARIETGINFRPITANFSFNTGLSTPKLSFFRRLFR